MGHMSGPREHFPLQKKNKVHFGATCLVIFVGPASTFPCKNQYKLHFGATYWVICVGHASTSPCKKQYKVPKLDHARAPRDHCQIVFDMDGGGAGRWPSVCRPTRYHDGHTSRLRIGFRHGWWGPTCIPMCAVTCAGAPGTRCARPAHGTPGAAGACGTLGARGARGASGAPGVPGTLGHQRRAHGVGSGPQ